MQIIDLLFAARLANESYDNVFTRPDVIMSCDIEDAEAYLVEGNILVLPGSNSVKDYVSYNLNLGDFEQIYAYFRRNPPDDLKEKDDHGHQWYRGFLEYTNLIQEWLDMNMIEPSFIVGHSLGAAAAQILSQIYPVPVIGFAPPRSCADSHMHEAASRVLLIGRSDDPVWRMPPGFDLVGRFYKIEPETPRTVPAHGMRHYVHAVKHNLELGLLPPQWPVVEGGIGSQTRIVQA